MPVGKPVVVQDQPQLAVCFICRDYDKAIDIRYPLSYYVNRN